ncbi:MAG: ATP-binding protein [Patescibacteria group bacterium]|nr:ATP-binding protein [Patescibacteria group bacterium]
MYIKRNIEEKIRKYLNRPEIIAIVGARQSGKTTTLKQIYKGLEGAVFLTFEDQQILSLFENNIKQFAETYVQGNKYLFIDEFQYTDNGGKLLKYLYDSYDIKIIISGSSAVDLTVKAIKFLVGRIFVLEMHPFDFYEYLLYRDLNYAKVYEKNKIDLNKCEKNFLAAEQMKVFRDYYEEYAIWGGYPQVVLSDDKDVKREVLKNIYNTYFLREVKDILGLVDDYKLSKLIKVLSLQIGNLVDYRNISQISDFSFLTLKKYINFLSKIYVSDFVAPFYKNKKKEIIKNPKIFFFDMGLRNFVIDDFRNFDSRTDAGALLENAVWSQLKKNGYEAHYWRDKNKNEIDFILKLKNKKIIAIEIKQNARKCGKFPLAFTDNYSDILTYCGYLDGGVNEHGFFIPLI